MSDPLKRRAHLARVFQNSTLAEMARGNPQWPQAFYPLKRVIDINPGDYLHARCTYDSTGRNRTTRIGRNCAATAT